MTEPNRSAPPDIAALVSLFPGGPEFDHSVVPAGEVPEPYQGLLIHHHHMTVTVERFYGRPVDVRVLEVKRHGSTYSRKILLRLQNGGRVVQFGIVRIHLDCCSDAVREAIVAEKTPLGRVLIEHNVLRDIRPTSFLRVEPGPAMREWFGMNEPGVTFGRVGVIFTDHKPAIEVLEILAPTPSEP